MSTRAPALIVVVAIASFASACGGREPAAVSPDTSGAPFAPRDGARDLVGGATVASGEQLGKADQVGGALTRELRTAAEAIRVAAAQDMQSDPRDITVFAQWRHWERTVSLADADGAAAYLLGARKGGRFGFKTAGDYLAVRDQSGAFRAFAVALVARFDSASQATLPVAGEREHAVSARVFDPNSYGNWDFLSAISDGQLGLDQVVVAVRADHAIDVAVRFDDGVVLASKRVGDALLAYLQVKRHEHGEAGASAAFLGRGAQQPYPARGEIYTDVVVSLQAHAGIANGAKLGQPCAYQYCAAGLRCDRGFYCQAL